MVLATYRLPSDILVVAILIISIIVLPLISTFKKTIYGHLKLYYIIIVHGKYSFEFVHFFSSKDLSNPLNSCIRDDITLHFKCFFNAENLNLTDYKTNTCISFKDIRFLISSKQLIKKYHKPDCFSATKVNGKVIKVYGFYEIIEKQTIRSLYYFANDKFIMGEYILPEDSHKLIRSILSAMSSRYLQNIPIDNDQIQIIGSDLNKIICMTSGFNYLIKYFHTGDLEFESFLRNLYRKKILDSQTGEISDILI
jgi:hypothetical protein